MYIICIPVEYFAVHTDDRIGRWCHIPIWWEWAHCTHANVLLIAQICTPHNGNISLRNVDMPFIAPVLPQLGPSLSKLDRDLNMRIVPQNMFHLNFKNNLIVDFILGMVSRDKIKIFYFMCFILISPGNFHEMKVFMISGMPWPASPESNVSPHHEI